MSMVSESSPLLVPEGSAENGSSSPKETSKPFPVLFELIGARNLPVTNMETYCVIQYGPRTIHRTKPFSPEISRAARITQALFRNRLFGGSEQPILQRSLQDPIWTVQEDSLLTFHASLNDIANRKALKITLWARPRGMLRTSRASRQLVSIGKIKIPAPTLLEECTEQRMEIQLMNELGQPITDDRGEPALLAYRCRIASQADLAFVENWNQVPRPQHWRDTGIIQEPDLPRAKLTTETTEMDIQAMAPKMNPIPPPEGHVRIKPYPDPRAKPENCRFITQEALKSQTRFPSQKWIQAGSKTSSIGRLYLEVLSAHGLPNVDIGSQVGNETDAFCAVVYGDAMAQTDVIYDELSPHWPSWSQRAFCFYMQHPSQVLYLSIFGYKRSPMQHKSIGRVEVNPIHFQNQVVYNLEYDLCGSSHATERKTEGRIRIRVRIEMEDQRKALLASLRPLPPVYINNLTRKSMAVARYTACGEYDNGARFSLQVLQGYIDEILEGYLRRILYSIQDAVESLIFWRDQIHIWGVGFPLYSLLAFCFGILVVEKPRLFPAVLCFMLALVLLRQMQERLASPSPWRRCFSFAHYLRVLVVGNSGDPTGTTIAANEGAEEFRAQQEVLRERIAHDKKFIEKKEAVEKQIEEIEKIKEYNSQPVPIELMVVLGKVQSIVGDVCRICRLCDAVVTWEESDVAFWITLGLLLLGTILIFIPWGFVLLWTGRILVVLCLGPQNKLLDLVWYQKVPTDEQRIYQIFASRMFEARCRQEAAGKLKSFRHILYGKFATWVPPIYWSPHKDFPLSASTAYRGGSKAPRSIEKVPLIPGQQLHGQLIPRPKGEWRRNVEESAKGKEAASAACTATKEAELQAAANHRSNHNTFRSSGSSLSAPSSTPQPRRQSIIAEEGLEILDLYDAEVGFVENITFNDKKDGGDSSSNTSDDADLGGRYQASSVHDFDSFDDDDDEDSMIILASAAPVRIDSDIRDEDDHHQSMIELGFEMAEDNGDYASMDRAEAAMLAFETLAAKSNTVSAAAAAAAAASNKDDGSTTKSSLVRNENWEMSSKVTTGMERTAQNEPSEGIQHAPTIVDATNDENDEEFGFEVMEN